MRLQPLESDEDAIELPSLDGQKNELKPLVKEHDSDAGLSSPSSSSSSSIDEPGEHGYDDSHGGPPPGSASNSQVVVNIIISFVGAGILGVPDAMRRAGWLLGSVALLTTSALNLYCMILLPAVKKALISGRYSHKAEQITSYGDVGLVILGERGEKVVNICLGISQAGFATAYIIFIAANLLHLANIPRSVTCLTCVPGLAFLVQFRSMAQLAPFSLLANVANGCALVSVLLQDAETVIKPHDDTIHAVRWDGFMYIVAITIYSMEGIGLILSLEASAKHHGAFRWLLQAVLAAISLFMAFFGSMGYWAFGDDTQAPVTLNLAGHWSSNFVKLALCLGLYLTFPVMMFPIWSISESVFPVLNEHAFSRIGFRASLVVLSALVAYAVPNFGNFLSLVGSSICTILGFILPCYFHLQVFGKELEVWQRALNYFLLVGGVLFGILGTYNSFLALASGDFEGEG
jgi:proton-coupled amino acid transporter